MAKAIVTRHSCFGLIRQTQDMKAIFWKYEKQTMKTIQRKKTEVII